MIADPIKLFDIWLSDAKKSGHFKDYNAFCLASSTRDGFPSCRILLLKGFSDEGFTFFTNKNSRKGGEVLQNKNVAMCFYWDKLGRQVRIEGVAEEVADGESDEYFKTRSYSSRVGAVVSKQSQILASYETLKNEYNSKVAELNEKEPKRPNHWGGFRLSPKVIEFWTEGEHRLHDRVLYKKSQSDLKWEVFNLYP